MYSDPDPYSTAVKSQSCQSKYIGFTIACVAVCVTGAKTREEGERSEEERSRNEKKVSFFFSSLYPSLFHFFQYLLRHLPHSLMIYNNRVFWRPDWSRTFAYDNTEKRIITEGSSLLCFLCAILRDIVKSK